MHCVASSGMGSKPPFAVNDSNLRHRGGRLPKGTLDATTHFRRRINAILDAADRQFKVPLKLSAGATRLGRFTLRHLAFNGQSRPLFEWRAA